jgi:hypothetical protein
MRDALVAKLRSTLYAGITTEPQVVYVMRSIRKLLEFDGAQHTYPALNFYCNWVLHTKLNGGSAKDVVKIFDDIYGAHQANDRPTLNALWKKFDILADGGSLKEQLNAYLLLNGLPNIVSSDRVGSSRARAACPGGNERGAFDRSPPSEPRTCGGGRSSD